MKKLLIIPIIIFFVQCKKQKIQRNCCKQGIVEQYVDSASIVCPNIFTPNGNGFNDQFTVKINNISSIEINVYNKKDEVICNAPYQIPANSAGNLAVWTGKHKGGKWDGQVLEGNYKFTIDAITSSGKNLHGEGDIATIVDTKKYCLKNMGSCKFSDGTNGTNEKFKCE